MSKNYPLCVLIEIKHVKEDEEFYVTAEIKDSQIRFQLDSGAKPNVMSAKVYRASKQGLKLNIKEMQDPSDTSSIPGTSPDPVPAKPVK